TPGYGLRHWPNGSPLGTGKHNIFGASPGIDGVVIEIDGGFPGGKERMRGVKFGTTQAAFFASHRDKQGGTARLFGARRPGASQFQQNPAAGGIIDGAVVNIV